MDEKIICSICKKEIEGESFNAWPSAPDRCCKECYDTVVCRAKFEKMRDLRTTNHNENQERERAKSATYHNK